jgi:hypothetical protein
MAREWPLLTIFTNFTKYLQKLFVNFVKMVSNGHSRTIHHTRSLLAWICAWHSHKYYLHGHVMYILKYQFLMNIYSYYKYFALYYITYMPEIWTHILCPLIFRRHLQVITLTSLLFLSATLKLIGSSISTMLKTSLKWAWAQIVTSL